MGLETSRQEKGARHKDHTVQDATYADRPWRPRADLGFLGAGAGGGGRLGNKAGDGEWLLMSTGFVLGSDRNVKCSKISLWQWFLNSTNTLKTTELCTLSR